MAKKQQNQPKTGRKKPANERDTLRARIIEKAVSQTTKDMADWRKAKKEAANVDSPKRVKIIELLLDIYQDTLLTSQVEQRIERSMAAPWRIVNAATGDENEDAGAALRASTGFADILYYILETPYWGHSLLELGHTVNVAGEADISVTLLPRQNVVPNRGKLLFDVSNDAGVVYRELPEAGVSLIEFGDDDDLGLLNKAVPMALFKRFAVQCWSQLCEIYGIPPRYLKTDTTDPAMLDRAEAMMRDIGAAAWFIIDTTEEFQFANAIPATGEVYQNLVDCCDAQMSLIIAGAQLGQDTRNGNRSKEEISIELLEKKAAADRRLAENHINARVLPALYMMGFVPAGLRFEWIAEEDDSDLWQRVKDAMPFYTIDPEWIKKRFGIEVTGTRQAEPAQLSAGFFA